MLGRSVTFGPKSVEKRPQQENFFELTTPTARYLKTSETRLGCGTKSILTYPAAEIIKLFEIICNNVFNDSPPNGRPNLKKRGKFLEVT